MDRLIRLKVYYRKIPLISYNSNTGNWYPNGSYINQYVIDPKTGYQLIFKRRWKRICSFDIKRGGFVYTVDPKNNWAESIGATCINNIDTGRYIEVSEDDLEKFRTRTAI